ncbi:hypothetical protein R6Q59_015667 [Mikania micrantha]
MIKRINEEVVTEIDYKNEGFCGSGCRFELRVCVLELFTLLDLKSEGESKVLQVWRFALHEFRINGDVSQMTV